MDTLDTAHGYCCCNHGWCSSEFRSQHAFPHQYVRLTTILDQIDYWKSALLIDSKNINKNPRVWIGHFHEEDIKVDEERDDDTLSCLGIHDITRVKFSYRNARIGKVPRPEVLVSQIELSWFGQNPTASYSDYRSHSIKTYSCLKKRKAPVPMEDNADPGSQTFNPMHVESVPPNPERLAKGPKIGAKKPFSESCVSTFAKLHEALRATEGHALECGKPLQLKRRDMGLCGFAGFFKVRCPDGRNCVCARNKHFGFDSSGSMVMEFCGSIQFHDKKVYTPNLLARYACQMTSVRPAAAEQFWIAQGLIPQSRNTTNQFVKEVVNPYILNRKAEIEAENCKAVRGNDDIEIQADTGFNSVRHAQACVTAVALGQLGRILFTIVKTDGPPAKMEAANMRRVFEVAVEDQKLDIGKCAMDQNATNRVVHSLIFL